MQFTTKVEVLKTEEKTFTFDNVKKTFLIITCWQPDSTDSQTYSVLSSSKIKPKKYDVIKMVAKVKAGIFGKTPVLKFSTEKIEIVK